MAFTRYLIALLACLAQASAHQPYESSAVGRMEAEGFEVVMTASSEIVSMLVGASVAKEAAFEQHREQARQVAAELYEVRVNGKSLKPQRLAVAFRGSEIVFSLMYPPVPTSELRVRAAYLEKLPADYGGTFRVFDHRGQRLDGPPVLRKGEALDSFAMAVRGPAVAESGRASDQQAKGIAQTAGTIAVSMNCLPGHNYKLQSSTTLEAATWTDVPGTTFTPTSTTSHAFTDPSPGADRKFYRVVIESAP